MTRAISNNRYNDSPISNKKSVLQTPITDVLLKTP